MSVPVEDWRRRERTRPAVIPARLAELPVGGGHLFRHTDGLAPYLKLWDRVTFYIWKERQSHPEKEFLRRVEAAGIRVQRIR